MSCSFDNLALAAPADEEEDVVEGAPEAATAARLSEEEEEEVKEMVVEGRLEVAVVDAMELGEAVDVVVE